MDNSTVSLEFSGMSQTQGHYVPQTSVDSFQKFQLVSLNKAPLNKLAMKHTFVFSFQEIRVMVK